VLCCAVQGITWHLHEQFPGRILTAEVTPENPMSVHELGFDSVPPASPPPAPLAPASLQPLRLEMHLMWAILMGL
jgi:hypothetical protein